MTRRELLVWAAALASQRHLVQHVSPLALPPPSRRSQPARGDPPSSRARDIRQRIVEGAPLADLDIVDVHAHIDDTGVEAVWPRGVDALLQDMDRCGIRVALFSHLGALMATTAEELRAAHDHAAAAVRRHPERLRAYVVFHPHLLDASLAALERIHAEPSTFVGIKLHGPIHRYPVAGPAWARAFRVADEHGLPVLCHLADGTETKTVVAVAKAHPGMTLILAHLWPGRALAAEVTRSVPNLFFDTCASSITRGAMARIIRSAGVDRLLFGSDATYLQAGGQVAKVGLADVTDESKRQILGANARTLFRDLPGAAG